MSVTFEKVIEPITREISNADGSESKNFSIQFETKNGIVNDARVRLVGTNLEAVFTLSKGSWHYIAASTQPHMRIPEGYIPSILKVLVPEASNFN